MSHDDPNANPNDEELNKEHVESQDDHEQDPNPDADSMTTPLCSVRVTPEHFQEKDAEENLEDGTNDQKEEEINDNDNDNGEPDQEEHVDEVKGTTTMKETELLVEEPIIIETDLTPESEAKSEHPEEEPEQEETDEIMETNSTEGTEPKFEQPMFECSIVFKHWP